MAISSEALGLPIVSKTANYTATAADYTILVDATAGAVTITLPAASSNRGRIFNIKKIDASGNAVIADGNAAELIDGAATLQTVVQWFNIQIQSNGVSWFSLSKS